MKKDVMPVAGAGISPSQAPVEAILKVDLYGWATANYYYGPLQPKA